MVMHFNKVGYMFNLTKYYPYFNATSMFGGQDGVQILSFLDFSLFSSSFFSGGNLVYSGVFGAWHASCSSV